MGCSGTNEKGLKTIQLFNRQRLGQRERLGPQLEQPRPWRLEHGPCRCGRWRLGQRLGQREPQQGHDKQLELGRQQQLERGLQGWRWRQRRGQGRERWPAENEWGNKRFFKKFCKFLFVWKLFVLERKELTACMLIVGLGLC